MKAVVWVPEIAAKWQADKVYFKQIGSNIIPSPDSESARWHGQACDVLGVFDRNSYAAIKFDWHGRYDYALVNPEHLRMEKIGD